ncbi:hypothetical protein C5167_022076 [Papaver somniferum]|uniref:Uncharacterized protein n=1 Tax=Papaver somniferum TaxID=3469 RepID=A0A4Y7JHU8_PAPSO|nr:hypothetical protein C5167_022076 [Papaver somniferum]
MLQNKEKSNGADNNQKELVPKTSSVISIIDENMLVYDILSRIPVKSLMQFKCVSKPWRSLIPDPYFVDLHFTRSKTLQRFFFTIPQVGSETENETWGIYYQEYQAYFKTTGLLSEESHRVGSTIPTVRRLRSAHCSEIIGGINSLICFVHSQDDAACIYNISTGETTPWIKSTVLRKARKWKTCCYIGSPTYSFGYDPATKKHKVMCMWNMSQKQEVNGRVAIFRRFTTDTAKLWIYEDDDKETTYKATSMDSTDMNWTENTITLPVPWFLFALMLDYVHRPVKAWCPYQKPKRSISVNLQQGSARRDAPGMN